HQDRLSDLALFADLGIKALRYPVLWERVAPNRPYDRDWSWTETRLAEIKRLGMRPIAGLTHHGSGPRYTHLLDAEFATGLAAHAGAVAERYPWVTDWTPVNEPLTTARFSALYGHWYPHAHDEGAFFSALLNQIDAVRLSMRAVRKVQPHARLIQTEDLGYTFATEPLAEQAEFENERRWLAWDLLTGRVDHNHYFWRRIASHGLGDRLSAVLDDPCPPDVLGVNHYLSSERLIDHRLERYPLNRRGGNGLQSYADVEAVRAVAPGPMGVERLLEAAWDRYRLPLAVTECHNGCTRDEQMRWLNEVWSAAAHLRARGVPVEAVTAWALLGSYDWNRLLTVDAGHYETGVFDLRGGAPRQTAMADLCRDLAHDSHGHHPALNTPGWWSRDVRYEFQPVWRPEPAIARRRWGHAHKEPQPLLITGATGTLGRAFARACEHRGLPYVLTCRNELDLKSPDSAAEAIARFDPWAVVNAAGFVRVDDAETEQAACITANAHGVGHLAGICADAGLPLVALSSDLVFDGRQERPYLETDRPSPLNIYGASKASAERLMSKAGGRGLVIRTSAFFSAHDPHNFAHHCVQALQRGEHFKAAADTIVSPTHTPDLVNAALDLLIDGETGVWHLASAGEGLSWAAFARLLARTAGLDERLVIDAAGADLGWTAARPAYSVLASTRGQVMPSLEDAVSRFVQATGISQPPQMQTRPGSTRPRQEAKSFASDLIAGIEIGPS
ncbi:MAG: family 1 glycosylhydrolase, partial [Caulobacteraceae bacterium]